MSEHVPEERTEEVPPILVTAVTIFPVDLRHDRMLLAYADVVVNDAIVIHNIRVVAGATGGLFIRMPDAPITQPCGSCDWSVKYHDHFCCNCGVRLEPREIPVDARGRKKAYADVVHPMDSESRETLRDAVLEAYYDAVQRESDRAAARVNPSSSPLGPRVRAGASS